MKPRPKRNPKTPSSAIGDAIRLSSLAYKADNQDEFARGMVESSYRVDSIIAKLGVEITPQMIEALGLPTEPVTLPPVKFREVSALEDHAARIASLEESVKDLVVCIRMNEASVAKLAEAIADAGKHAPVKEVVVAAVAKAPPAIEAPFSNEVVAARPSRNDGLSKIERRLLHALIQRGKPTSTKLLAALAGYSMNGNVRAARGAIRSAGYIVGPGDANEITEAGRSAAGPVEPLPHGNELVEHWCQRVKNACAARILRVLVHCYPADVGRANLLEQAGYQDNGNVRSAIGALRRRNLVEKRLLRATDELMEGVRRRS